jgi:hypothetical protein
MPVPNTFANATTSIPLSQLDNNFATPITIGNTAVQLGNTVTTLNNMTLANVTISGGTSNGVAFTNVTITSGTANAVTIGNGTFTNYTESQVNIGNSSTTQTIALSNGTVQTVTLTANCTFTMPTVAAGKSFLVLIKSGSGGFTGTFTGVKFPGNTAPTITNTASRMDIIAFSSDGTNWYGTASQNYYV